MCDSAVYNTFATLYLYDALSERDTNNSNSNGNNNDN